MNLKTFFETQMDYVFFFYGASFIMLAAVCLAILRRRNESDDSPVWLWLGLFGFIHGLNEWLDMAAVSFGDQFYLRPIRLICLISSFVCLMEFGRQSHANIFRKNIGPVIYFFIGFLAFLGIFFGWPGIQATSRYFFGFIGCFWAAVILYFYDGIQKNLLSKYARISLKIAAVGMLLYGVATGLIVPRAGFFPASILNTDSFFAAIGIPIQFFRGLFAFIIASGIVLHSIKQSMVIFIRDDSRREKIFLESAVCFFALMLLLFYSGWRVVEHHGNRVEMEERASRRLKVRIFSQLIGSEIKRLHGIEAMAFSSVVVLSLKEKNPQTLLDLNENLDRFTRALGAGVGYVIEPNGITYASTNRNTPKSFVGKDYSFRPYFQEAMKGRSSVYLAKGVTSNERGIYVSYPVSDPVALNQNRFGALAQSNKILGVAVLKSQLDRLDECFQSYPYVFLVSPEGVIFISSKPEWLFRSIRDLSLREKEALRETRQFGAGPWDNVGFQKRNDDQGTMLFRGTKFHFDLGSIEELADWKIYFIDDKSDVSSTRFTLIMIFLSFFLLISIVVLFIFRIFLDTLRLLASETLYEALVEGLPDYISLFSIHGFCLSINKRGLAMMGWQRESVIGVSFLDLWPKDYSAKLKSALYKVSSGSAETAEIVIHQGTGVSGIYQVLLVPIFEAGGEVKYFIAIVRDVSEERRGRDRLLQTSKMETVGALAMGVSHEFNNALEIILGNAELAYASKDSEAIKKRLNTIIESARRASWIIKNMLDFSRQEAETRTLVDLEEVLRQNISFLSKTFESQGIELDLHLSSVPRLYGNSGQLSQAFVNIMMNAREAMRGGIEKKLTITMEYFVEKAEVRIYFRDTGPGIKQEIKDKIFGPFVTTKGILGGGVDKKPGIGLGLFISYGIIKQHNGNITVESQEGKGANFCITLPISIEGRFDRE